MITSFRKFFQSKFGMAVFLGFLAVVAFAFAGAEISGTSIGGVSPGERVAAVGQDTITTGELTGTTQTALRGIQRGNPTVTMPVFLAEGGLDEVLSQMIDRFAIGAYAEQTGLRAGENLVNSEILQLPAFRGVSGEFDQSVFERRLAEQRISEAVLRRDLADGLLAQQLLLPAGASAQMPQKAARLYASLFFEQRSGRIALIPSALYASDEALEDAAVEAYYSQNRTDYINPERRTLRFAVFNADNLTANITPSEDEIAARYERDKLQYAARESRDVTLFTVPTQEGATALVEQIRAGKSLEIAAREAGFNTTQVTDRDQEQFASATSYATAQAVFAASNGDIIEPAQGTLGWYIARVDAITDTPESALADVRETIAQALTEEKRAAALGDLSAEIEKQVDLGTSLTEIADTFDLTLQESPPLLTDGRVFGDPLAPANPALRPILDTAFGLDESQPQLDTLVPGSQFLVYDVTDIVESAAPPLADIRERVEGDLRLAQASERAKEAADRVMEKTGGDTTLAEALGQEDADLPRADTVSLARAEIEQLRARGNVPPALVLLFSMSEGAVKRLEAPGNQGWILVALDEIVAGEVPEGSPIIAQSQQQLAESLSAEYTEQFVKAMREDVGVETNETALESVRKRLLGET
ncbi:MAG: SurA N-terminal domain-containing protein [Pseudomonadota bacterium]